MFNIILSSQTGFDIASNLISTSLNYFVPLMIVALAGLFAEKSGTVNIALEGIMVIGALIGTLVLRFLSPISVFASNPTLLYLIALAVAGVAGLIFSSLLGFIAIKMKADQIIGGTAINILAGAIAIYLPMSILKDINGNAVSLVDFNTADLRYYLGIPKNGTNSFLNFVENIFVNNLSITFYLSLVLLIIVIIIFKYTRYGLRLQACGENPHAAQSLGVNVIKYRWIGVLSSGFLAGIGGLALIVSISGGVFQGSVYGYGFLGLAVLIFGQWKPKTIFFAALIFGMFNSVSNNFTVIFPNVGQSGDNIYSLIFKILPYILTIVTLAIFSKKSKAPKASGIPFEPNAA